MTDAKTVDNKKGILKESTHKTSTGTQGEGDNKGYKSGRGRNDKFGSHVNSQGYDYGGKNKAIDVILALQTERLKKSGLFSVY